MGKIIWRRIYKKNKNNCKIIIENKEQDIIEYLDINENLRDKEILNIKFKEIKKITDMSYVLWLFKTNIITRYFKVGY